MAVLLSGLVSGYLNQPTGKGQINPLAELGKYQNALYHR